MSQIAADGQSDTKPTKTLQNPPPLAPKKTQLLSLKGKSHLKNQVRFKLGGLVGFGGWDFLLSVKKDLCKLCL